MSQMEGSTPLEHQNKIGNTASKITDVITKLESRSRFTLFIAWMALFFTVVGIAAGYKNWMQINTRAKQATDGVSELKQQVNQFANKSEVMALNSQLLTALDNKDEKFNHNVHRLERVEKNTQHAVKSMDQQMALLTQQQEQSHASSLTPTMAWRLAELRFLLQLANQRLQLNKDKNGALQALNRAEAILLKFGSSDYLPVRKKIGEEIVALETFLIPNITAISQRITDFLVVINAMPVEAELIKQQKITLLPSVSEDKNAFLSGIVAGINDAVVIQKFDASMQKSIGMDEREKLKNLLQLRFETLRLMVLQGLDFDYHQQLKLIKQTLEKYYPEVIKGSLQEQLEELDKVKLSPPPPDISGSLLHLDQIITGK
jgi:uncharacterized protein HemX